MKASDSHPLPRQSLLGRVGLKCWTWRHFGGKAAGAGLRLPGDPGDRLEHKTSQWRRLRALLQHAWETAPLHRQRMAEAQMPPRKVLIEDDLRQLPLTLPPDLVYRGNALLSAAERSPQFRQVELPEGQAEIAVDQRRVRIEQAEWLWADSVAGWQPGQAVVRIAAMPPGEPRLQQWLRRRLLQPVVRVSADDVDELDLDTFIRQYLASGAVLLLGDSRPLGRLAGRIEQAGQSLPAPRAVVCCDGPPAGEHVEALRRVFAKPALGRYWREEFGLAACQCPAGGYHVNMHRLYVEIVDDSGQPVKEGRLGRLVVTDLGNFAMPLIRYAPGDLAAWSAERECPCGTGTECLETIELARQEARS